MNSLDELRDLPPGLLWVLGALVAVQLLLIIGALVVLARTSRERMKLLPRIAQKHLREGLLWQPHILILEINEPSPSRTRDLTDFRQIQE